MPVLTAAGSVIVLSSRTMRRTALLLAVLGGCNGSDKLPPLPPACETPIAGSNITYRLVAQTQGAAMLVTSPPRDLRRFVVEQEGRIKILTDTGLSATPFLDLSNDVACCGERGLLGLAFHPDYATNRTFFVFYTTESANIVARYQANVMNPDIADPAGVIVLSIPDFASNHNGGMIEFGADGFLYIGTGDGGGGGDPRRTGQDPNSLLGKILRSDVDRKLPGKEYGIPSANPFADGTQGAPEVYIMGLRNPWRWSFDRMTGDLWIGDVGQDAIEELTVIKAGTSNVINLGWSMYEGANCFNAPCDPVGKIMPQYSAPHSDSWCSIIGGEVYRGSCYTDLVGKYIFTDYCAHSTIVASGPLNALTFANASATYIDGDGTHNGTPSTPASLHADARGELYLTTTECCGTSLRGGVWHVEAGP